MLDCYTFGRLLLDGGDLDPVYTILYGAGLPRVFLERWLLAYWCFYHVGTASWIADRYQPGVRGFRVDTRYWAAMREAAGSSRYPRSRERRHFRGENARKSVEWLESVGAGSLWADLYRIGGRRGGTATELISHVQGWVGFGPWISFKVADMVERLGLAPGLRFDDGDLTLYDSPRRGAADLAAWEGKTHSGAGTVDWAVNRILNELGHYPAPPSGDRFLGVQEAETILCKWHSYLGGHYEVGEDVRACYDGLLKFARCKTAQVLLKSARDAGLKRTTHA